MDTYGDMVTLLLCFFVLLYSMSTISEEKFKAIVQSFNPSSLEASTVTSGSQGPLADPSEGIGSDYGLSPPDETEIEQADIENYAKKVAKMQFAQYGMASVPDDVLESYTKEMLKNKEQINRMVDQVLEEKIMKKVKDTVKLDRKTVSMDEFNKLFEKK